MKKISRLLNHLTLRQLNNYALETNAEIDINDGSVEEVILEVSKCN